MKVKYATQIFSQVKAATKTAVQINELAPEAAKFIGCLNDVFDCLNSKSLIDSNPLRYKKSTQGQFVQEKLNNSLPWIKKLEVEKFRIVKDAIVKKLTKPPSIHGF